MKPYNEQNEGERAVFIATILAALTLGVIGLIIYGLVKLL